MYDCRSSIATLDWHWSNTYDSISIPIENSSDMSQSTFLHDNYRIHSSNLQYDPVSRSTIAKYSYDTTVVKGQDVYTKTEKLVFKTSTVVPRTGLLLVGLGGNNGSTITAGVLANKRGLSWETKEGVVHSNYFGSLTQCSTVKLGLNENGEQVYIPFKNMLPMIDPNDLVIHGWDISSLNLGEGMKRAKVLDVNLQKQLYDEMKEIVPMPGVYQENFIAANQLERADNILKGSKKEMVNTIRKNIQDFKKNNSLDKVIILWTANTERFCEIQTGVNDTATNLLEAIERNEDEVSPSSLYAVASILEGCSYINGSPQNTFVPGVIELAEKHGVFIAGDDFKSGQTKMKSVLVDFLVSAGIKPASIVSYNHLGNNDGMNLSAPQQFRSKEISKSNVVDDMVNSNRILYGENEHPDHCVVIKYVPYVGDSKRAMDEYTSEIFMGGKNTIILHNTCEDSLLATPIILDLAILCEICERIQVKKEEEDDSHYEKMNCVLSLLSYLLKAPLVPAGTPVINALGAQRQCIVNVFRACLALPPENYMLLEHKLPCFMNAKAPVSEKNGVLKHEKDVKNGKHVHEAADNIVEVQVKKQKIV